MGAGAAAGRTRASTAGDGDRRRGVGGKGRELFGRLPGAAAERTGRGFVREGSRQIFKRFLAAWAMVFVNRHGYTLEKRGDFRNSHCMLPSERALTFHQPRFSFVLNLCYNPNNYCFEKEERDDKFYLL